MKIKVITWNMGDAMKSLKSYDDWLVELSKNWSQLITTKYDIIAVCLQEFSYRNEYYRYFKDAFKKFLNLKFNTEYYNIGKISTVIKQNFRVCISVFTVSTPENKKSSIKYKLGTFIFR